MNSELIESLSEKMARTVDAFRQELSRIRTGRASLSLLDGITVDAYGSAMPLNQVAALTIPESRLIVLQPWDPHVLSSIEKAIQKSDLDLTPVSDGKVIRINIPQLTEERRKEMVKRMKKIAEEHRVAIRNLRRDAIEALKKQKKNKEISEDDLFRLQEDAQKATDRFIEDLDGVAAGKEKEVMEV